MRPTLHRAALLLALCLVLPAIRAETLTEALHSAYRNSALIRSAQAQWSSTSEAIPLAEAKRLPRMTLTGTKGWHSDYTYDYNVFGPPSPGTDRYRVQTVAFQLKQSLYHGGGLVAGIEKAEADTAAQSAALAGTVQSVLLNAATAYIDTLRARGDLTVTQRSVEELTVQKESVERGMARKDLTLVDLDQAISRLEDARAQYQQALGQLESAQANYRRWIGHPPGELVIPAPLTHLPASRNETLSLAESGAHSVRQASLAEQSARADITLAIAPNLPNVTLVANYSREIDRLASSRGIDKNYSLMLQVTIPLYQGGAPSAQIRSSREAHRQRQLQEEQARNTARQTAASAWNARQSAQADLDSRLVQGKAARIALDGLQHQQARGNRSVLDVLNGHQDLLTAKLAENKARRDLAVSEYRILAAIGRLDLENLAASMPGFIRQGKDGAKRWTDYNAWQRTQ